MPQILMKSDPLTPDYIIQQQQIELVISHFAGVPIKPSKSRTMSTTTSQETDSSRSLLEVLDHQLPPEEKPIDLKWIKWLIVFLCTVSNVLVIGSFVTSFTDLDRSSCKVSPSKHKSAIIKVYFHN